MSVDDESSDRSLLVDALIGAVASVVLSFLPFSPAIGGALAGYLHREEGVLVGGLSGVLAALPVFLVFSFVLSVLSVGFALAELPAFPIGIVAVVAVFALIFVTLVSAALGALGGLVGEALAERE